MGRQRPRDDEAPTRRRRGPHFGLVAGVALLAAFALGFAIASLHPDSRREPPPVLLASDTAADPDPLPFWGALECASESRYRWLERGGDPQPTGTGRPQGNTAFRQLTVFDGDDFFGERCELGANDNQGPVAFYREGDHRITYASFRLPGDFPLGAKNWQGVLQMKQAQTADNGGGTPVLSLGAYDGEWLLFGSGPGPTDVDQVIWRAPASKQLWTRFRIEALYSQDPGRGWIEVQVDLDGDGNLEDEDERSPRIQTNTLKREAPGDERDGLRAGDSIPSHLRTGIYHDERIACPRPSGCSVGVDNVQVLRPRGE